MNIVTEVKVDETGIIKQMEAEKKAGDQYGDEMHKLRMLLSRSEATAIVKKESPFSELCTQ